MFKLLKSLPKVVNDLVKEADPETPDRLIAAKIIHSFATDFEKWKAEGASTLSPIQKSAKPSETWRGEDLYRRCRLTNSSLDISFDVAFTDKINYNKDAGVYDRVWGVPIINRMDFPKDLGEEILTAYSLVAAEVQKLKQIARDAEEAMKLNEKKWDLAEKVLGMKRNEFGALVPIETPTMTRP